ncbi:hypothetical protein GF322_05305 [Candidatus Dependentiae bacterium]|nr:hypothetical protein [Candidatus Dependentiae bacterium]
MKRSLLSLFEAYIKRLPKDCRIQIIYFMMLLERLSVRSSFFLINNLDLNKFDLLSRWNYLNKYLNVLWKIIYKFFYDGCYIKISNDSQENLKMEKDILRSLDWNLYFSSESIKDFMNYFLIQYLKVDLSIQCECY